MRWRSFPKGQRIIWRHSLNWKSTSCWIIRGATEKWRWVWRVFRGEIVFRANGLFFFFFRILHKRLTWRVMRSNWIRITTRDTTYERNRTWNKATLRWRWVIASERWNWVKWRRLRRLRRFWLGIMMRWFVCNRLTRQRICSGDIYDNLNWKWKYT